jgi:hypothetical protein
VRGDVGERDGGIEERRLRRRRRGRRLRIREDDVLAGPDRFEAGGLGRARDARRRLGLRAGTEVDAEEPELHGATFGGSTVSDSITTSFSGRSGGP